MGSQVKKNRRSKVRHWFKLSEGTQSFLLGLLMHRLSEYEADGHKQNETRILILQQASQELGWGKL